jgi:hypothetical protein
MNSPPTGGAVSRSRRAPWRKYRLVLLAGGIAAWFAVVTIAHQRAEARARGTNKGAKELLQIGALPVT